MANNLLLRIRVDDRGNPALEDMQTNITRLNRSVRRSGSLFGKVFGANLAASAVSKGIELMVEGMRAMTEEAINFQNTFKQIEGITKTSGDELKFLSDQAINASNSTEFLGTEVAAATLQISKMGLTVAESKKALPGIMDLATASVVELSDAAQLTISTLKSFQLEMDQTDRVANIIHATVSGTAIDMEDFGEAMKFVAPISKTLNVSLEETAALIGSLGDVGLRGSIAGTSIKNILLDITTPTEATAKAIENFEVKGKSLADVLRRMQDEFGKDTLVKFMEQFNLRALGGALNIGQMNDKFAELLENLKDSEGGVQAAADVIRDSLLNELKQTKAALFNVGTVFLLTMQDMEGGAKGPLKTLQEAFVDTQEWIKENEDSLKRLMGSLLKMADIIIKNTVVVLGTLADGFITVVEQAEKAANFINFGMGRTDKDLREMSEAMNDGSTDGIENKIKAYQRALVEVNELSRQVGNLDKESDDYFDRLKAVSLENAINSVFKRSIGKIAEEHNLSIDLLLGKDASQMTREITELEQALDKSIRSVDLNTAALEKPKKDDKPKEGLAEFLKRRAKDLEAEKARKEREKAAKKTKKEDVGLFQERWAKQIGKELASSIVDARTPSDLATLKEFIPLAKLDINDSTKLFNDHLNALSKEVLSNAEVQKILSTSTVKVSDNIKNFGKDQLDFAKLVQERVKAKGDPDKLFKVDATQIPVKELEGIGTRFAEAILRAMQAELQRSEGSVIKGVASEGLKLTKATLKADKKAKKTDKKESDFVKNQIDQWGNLALQGLSILDGFFDAAHQKEMDRLSKRSDLIKKNQADELANFKGTAESKALLMADFAAQNKQIEKEKADAEKEAARERSAIAYTESIIASSLAFVKALPNIPLAISVGALGLGKAGLIAAQSFNGGGFVSDPFSGSTGDRVPAFLSPGEAVVSKANVDAIGGQHSFKQMLDENVENSLVRNDGSSGTMITINGNVIGEKEFVRKLTNQIQSELTRRN